MAPDERITVVRVMDRLNIGGPAIHAVLTTKGLNPLRFRTVLVVGEVEPGEGDMGYLLKQHGVTNVISIPTLGRELRPLRDVFTLWELMKVLRREKPHIVHTHKAKAGALGRIAAAICQVPVCVHTFHGHVLSGYFGATKSRVFTGIERALARLTSVVVAPSAAVAHELATRFKVAPLERFVVVPLGFDLDPFAQCEGYRGQLRDELGVGPSTRLVGIVGRMVAVKDHATFVAAAAELAYRHQDIHFVLVGGGDLHDSIAADLDRRGLGAKAHMLGWRADMARIYADLDVLALCSINEGTPVTLIEAMASGVPVVATQVGGVVDVLKSGARGELVAPKDALGLAAGIERAMLPGARDRAVNVRAEVLRDYGAQRLCQDLEDLYLRLLAGKPLAAEQTPSAQPRLV